MSLHKVNSECLIVNENKKTCRSKVELPVDKCNFTWTIENYSMYYTNFDAGQYHYSSEFFTGPSCSDLEWKLAIMPSNIVNNVEHVGIYLQLCKNNLDPYYIVNSNRLVKLEIFLMNMKDNKIIGKNNRLAISDFKELPNNLCGWNNFIERSKLIEKIDGIHGGTLKVCCSLEVIYKAKLTEVASYSMGGSDWKRKLSSDFKALCDNPQHSDIILHTEGGDFHAHKAILSARSSVFSGMFNHNMKETQENIVCIKDISAPVLKAMLQYIYCGQIEELHSKYYSELYTAADKYCLLDLKQKCSKKISSILSLENWYETANLADLYDEKELYSAIRDFISKNARAVVTSSQWAELITKKPDLLLEITKPKLTFEKHDDNRYDSQSQSDQSAHSDDSEWESD